MQSPLLSVFVKGVYLIAESISGRNVLADRFDVVEEDQ
jgi:hypothetical protein